MPLLTSPIDGSPMRQINRYGIEFDVCPTTGGIWLDKGELEKLMAIIKEETGGETPAQYRQQQAPQYVQQQHAPQQGYAQQRHYHDDDDDDYKRGHYKKSKASKLMDIFDF